MRNIPDDVFHVTSIPAGTPKRTIGPWGMNLIPSERKASIRQHRLIHSSRFQCSRLEFDSAVTLTGSVPHGFVTFVISQTSVGRPLVNNHALRPNEIVVLHSCEPVHYICEPNETIFILSTTLEHYAQCLEEHSVIDIFAHRKEQRFQAANFKLIQAALEKIGTYFINAKQRRGAAIESVLLVSLLRALTPVSRSELNSPRRRKVATDVMDYIHQNTKKSLNMTALVTQFETTSRSLHHGFSETFGISPIAYIKNLRLANVRRDLIRNTWPTVTETAMYWNFHHLGRFSKAYQDAYGEPPSETARRNAAN
ncbi:AraC family transcriptional regulator [Pseudomonas sp. NFIX28]|uniref:AraC family transcriptional regulator n=1 Tax=Pseudomonas sp. NFIX28 TaxID=1566235 RepID=UPI00089891A5|nr:AraC family transcriptional regulator [Pseudomonas sp. NFIX28]SDY57901.1 AraC family transcriptional regulator, ethanolamine operon transcriptional activator [Pseudomonas sp. NFIX28]